MLLDRAVAVRGSCRKLLDDAQGLDGRRDASSTTSLHAFVIFNIIQCITLAITGPQSQCGDAAAGSCEL
jgi:hypothetical protein